VGRKVCQALEGGEVVTGSNRFGKASGNARHHPEENHEEARTAQEQGAGGQPPTITGSNSEGPDPTSACGVE